MKFYVALLLMLLPSLLTAQTERFTGTDKQVDWISLPEGSIWRDYLGEDSCPGTIKLPSGLQIDFDHFLMAGRAVSKEKAKEYLTFKEERLANGQTIYSASQPNGKFVVTLSDKSLGTVHTEFHANFFAVPKNKKETEEFMKITRTFVIKKYMTHIQNVPKHATPHPMN